MSKLVQHKLSDLYEMSSGISSKPEQAGHGAPFVSFKTVFNNYFLPDELPDLMETSEEEQVVFSVKEGDIFLTRTSETLDELGMSSVAYKEYPRATYSGFLKRLRPIKSTTAYPKYMAFYLRSELFRKAMNNNAIMTLRASFNEQIFSYLNILLPPYEEQKRAGDLLFLLYEKIELNNRINFELEQIAKTLYDYWFVQFDFPDAQGKPYKASGGIMVYNEALKREIPEKWEVKKLYTIANITMGQSPSGESYNEEGKGIVFFQGSTDFGWRFPENRFYTTAPTRLAKEDDILLSVRAPIGTMNLAIKSCCIGRGLAALNSKDGYSSFLIYQMTYFKKKFDYLNSVGTTFGSLTKDELYNLELVYPPKNILVEFEKRVSVFDIKIKNNFLQNQQLSSLRDWLLPMLMNGQVKVASNGISATENTSMAAEPQTGYEKTVPLIIPANKKGFAKQVLAGKIVSKFIDDPNFTDIKFQKIQFLAEHIIKADLNLNYYYQAAGPYDNKFMHAIYSDFHKQKWFDFTSKRFIPLEKREKIEVYFQGYFDSVQNQLNKLFDLLYNASEAEAEIIATLYAVWNNRVLLNHEINNEVLFEDFYNWSDRKRVYSIKQVKAGLDWLRVNHFEPTGFGNVIKKAIK